MRTRVLFAAVLLALPAVAAERPQATATVRAEVAPPQIVATTVSLDDLVREAVENNPALAGMATMVEARRRRVPQSKALPDPQLSVGWMGSAVPFKTMRDQMGPDPSSYRSVQAMQMIPLGGKRGLRGSMAAKEADAAQWDWEGARRRLVADVKLAFYEYLYTRQALEIARKNQALLEKLSRIAEVRYQVGKGMQADVLRGHVEQSRIRQRIAMLEQQHEAARAQLNALTNRPPESPLPPAATAAQARMARSLDELYQLAKANDAELAREQQAIERNQLAVSLAKKELIPDLTVGWMYQQRPGLDDMNGATVTLNIPLFAGSKQKEMVKEAQLELSASQRARQGREAQLYFEVKEQYLMAKAAEELVGLYSQGVVPQSSLALESSMSAYEAGTVDFMTVLTNFTTVLDYETEYWRERANLNAALARLEPLVGVELTGGGR